ncbi:hypothetical protein [Pseudonocardia adelaidensis]|uniref:Uncharacterized protein n=1 Tax=Pseudonocardia adelaidensis TaxID=648754 RepID=A0ABP9P193_9PSEU
MSDHQDVRIGAFVFTSRYEGSPPERCWRVKDVIPEVRERLALAG